MKKTLFLMVLFTTLFVSCKKETCPVPLVPTPPIDLSGSTFVGSTVFPATTQATTIVLNADGTAIFTFATLQPITGNWSKTPNSNTVNLFFVETPGVNAKNWNGNATFNASNNKLENGVFNRTSPTTLTGTFTATKQ